MTDISYLEAWDMWFHNVQVNQHTLYGWSILALGRAGKVIAFLSGMTIIMDIIGPERIREFGSRYTSFDPIRSRRLNAVYAATALCMLAGTAATLLVIWFPSWRDVLVRIYAGGTVFGALALLLGAPWLMKWAVETSAKALRNPKVERLIRWIAMVGLILGFHFDLLAS
ncbi:hypothetical protein [Nonomuraea wenchangensis]|uniref:Uncharacterized protein n=1 Tax=Nonomuraea wenchangensis TaxID=568860 RepID=A0A1H9YJS6_9ACTN|nr:hypothetical protein [Nonomuraea wenchangensis]SES69203.1 hypothetical protein SAMN05421811_10166 [Nonomuraea wenchangensis]